MSGETRYAEIGRLSSPASAPHTIRFSLKNVALFQTLWRQSLLANGGAKERGGTIVTDRGGLLSLINIGGKGSNQDTFVPDYSLPDRDHAVVGVFHTHPYPESQGRVSGVSFTGQDVIKMVGDKLRILVVQSGPRLFVLLRTGQTQPIEHPQLAYLVHRKAVVDEVAGGRTMPQASRIVNERFAAGRYGMAYYQGSNGVVTRVSP